MVSEKVERCRGVARVGVKRRGYREMKIRAALGGGVFNLRFLGHFEGIFWKWSRIKLGRNEMRAKMNSRQGSFFR
jgi:hypothetical protein